MRGVPNITEGPGNLSLNLSSSDSIGAVATGSVDCSLPLSTLADLYGKESVQYMSCLASMKNQSVEVTYTIWQIQQYPIEWAVGLNAALAFLGIAGPKIDKLLRYVVVDLLDIELQDDVDLSPIPGKIEFSTRYLMLVVMYYVNAVLLAMVAFKHVYG